MPPPTIRTKRTLLRAISTDDAADLHAVLSDEQVMRYWSSPPHASLAETQAYVAVNADMEACWAIVVDGRAIGWTLLLPRRDGVAELGYITGRDWWGRGLAREAVAATLAHGFGAMALRRVCADIDPDNGGSLRLLAALGFQREGYLRAEWHTHIGVRDSVIMGLLAAEWSRPGPQLPHKD